MRFAPFEAETPSGWISFRGQGSLKTGPAEQRALAEWARLMLLEAQSGRSTPDQGLALAWHREGGIAGFCDDLLVYAYGRVQATNCKSSPADARTLQLDAAQLEQLFTWLDGYLPIQDYQTDPATAAERHGLARGRRRGEAGAERFRLCAVCAGDGISRGSASK